MHHYFNYLLLASLVLLGSKTLNAQQRKSTASPQVSHFEIAAPQLQTQKKIWVYLPKDYTRDKHKKYPVLYMHDAQNLFDDSTSYVGEWKVDETLDSLRAQVIVIGIEHGNDKRIEELTPYPSPKYGGGKADAYLDFIVKTLKPEIDKRYRTKTKAKHTGIMGSSLGGLVSYYAVLKYPKVFGKAGVFSASFWYADEIYTLTQNTKKIKSKLYFLCGDKESEHMVAEQRRMVQLVSGKRCDCLHLSKEIVVADGEHNEKLWSKSFAKAYLWLY